MQKTKLIKQSLLALTLLPIGAMSIIENDASEVSTYDLPGIDQRPEQPEPPKPEPEKPVEPTPPTQPETPSPEVPEEKPDVKPEPPKPAPPVHVPTIKQEVTYDGTSTSPNIIIKQSEIGSDLVGLAGLSVSKTTKTFSDGVLTDTDTSDVTPIIKNQPTNQIGVQTITYGTEGTDKTWTFNVNVVDDTTIISQDRYLGMQIAKPEITLTQSQAQKLKTVDDFIATNGVTAFDASGATQTVSMPKQVGAMDVFAGKVGTHTVEYGIAKQYNTRGTGAFTATATITVVEDPKVPTPINPDAIVDGLVDKEQLKDENGNQVAKVEQHQEDKVVQQGGTYQPKSSVQTGIATTSIALTAVIGISVLGLLFMKKNK